MEAVVDSRGRIVVPKPLRDALGLDGGTTVDISIDGESLRLIPRGPTARLAIVDGMLIAQSDRVVTDDALFNLIYANRR